MVRLLRHFENNSTEDVMHYVLPSSIILRAVGRDVVRYLNNRLSNDVRSLVVGDSVIAGALTAQGRPEALFYVYRVGEEEFLLACDGGDREAVKTALCRFIVADRVTVTDESENLCCLYVDRDSLRADVEPHAVVARPSRRTSDSGFDLLISRADLSVVEDVLRSAGSVPARKDTYDFARISYGSPVFPDEISSDAVITETTGKTAVSFTKGCYVGQEVIERSDAIGRLPRSLERIEFSDAEIHSKDPVVDGTGKTIGAILSTAVSADRARLLAFALLRNGLYAPDDAVSAAGHAGRIMRREERTA